MSTTSSPLPNPNTAPAATPSGPEPEDAQRAAEAQPPPKRSLNEAAHKLGH
jgi:hypothetical protein